jgi:hypothetical protein
MVLVISENTITKIEEINNQLKSKCIDLELSIFNFGIDIKLCLNLNSQCVSDLIITDDNSTFNILSETSENHRGKGYNKFLTAVSIYLAKTLMEKKIDYLFSSTVVKERIHILSQYKNYIVEKLKENKKNHGIDEDEDEDEDEDTTYIFHIPIDDNETFAKEIIDTWINNNCTKKGGKFKYSTKKNKKGKKNKTKKQKIKTYKK